MERRIEKKIIAPAAILLDGRLAWGRAVYIEAGRIVATDTLELLQASYPDAKVEHWRNLALVPGTVNAHNHSFQSLLRGIAADQPFLTWRDESLYKYSPLMRPKDIYTGALFAFAEMMKCGVTTVCDFFYLHNDGIAGDEAVIRAAKDIGIRLVLARTMYDWDGAPKGYVEDVKTAAANTEMLMQKYKGGMAKVIPAPHSLHAATPEMVQAGHELAEKYNTPMHIHVSEERFEVEQVKKEFGTTPLRLLHKLGVVDKRLNILHGVWLEHEEIELMGEAKAQLIYCPSSNMFLADGITDIPAYMKNQVPVALGSDGACGNNRISVFEEARMVAILQKAKTLDALCVKYDDAWKMATTGGARALNLPVGDIVPGKYADFVGIKLDDFSMQPLSSNQQFLPNLVYSLQPTAIDRVMVNGQDTVVEGKLMGVSESEVLARVHATMEYLEEQ